MEFIIGGLIGFGIGVLFGYIVWGINRSSEGKVVGGGSGGSNDKPNDNLEQT